MKNSIFLILLVFTVFSQWAAPVQNEELSKVKAKLAKATNPKDSLKLLYDIFDLSPRNDYLRIGKDIDDVAKRAGNIKARYDIARQMANALSVDSLLEDIEEHVRSLPPSKEQKETELFVKIRRIAINSKHVSDQERKTILSRTMAMDDFDKLDKYQKIERLYTICEYLNGFVDGDLLVGYLDDLSKVMKDSEIESYALYNTFYTESANIYSATGSMEKALAADRELLNVIENLEKKYQADGRHYRNYDISRYVIYRRMLSNYKALPVDEVNDIYEKILELCASHPDVASDFAQKSRTSAYHAIKNKRYVEAISYIKKQLKLDNTVSTKRQMLEMLMEAAQATGDNATYELAKKQYDESSREAAMMDSITKYQELQLRYNVNMLKQENSRLELETKNVEITSARRLMAFVIVGWVVFAIILVVLLFFWSRYRRTNANLSDFVESLVAERDSLKKRTYQDSQDEEMEVKYGQRPKNGDLSSMINYVINDVMYISSIGKSDIGKFHDLVSVDEVMKEGLEQVEPSVGGAINFNITYPDPDFFIDTDKECLDYVVRHILKLAASKTPSGGSVGFSASEDKTLKMARFVFTHSGSSFHRGQEERIFADFMDYKELSKNGEGALFMCRMVNFLMNCTLRADHGYEMGAKLVLMIPLK